jgi:hypothetical protein
VLGSCWHADLALSEIVVFIMVSVRTYVDRRAATKIRLPRFRGCVVVCIIRLPRFRGCVVVCRSRLRRTERELYLCSWRPVAGRRPIFVSDKSSINILCRYVTADRLIYPTRSGCHARACFTLSESDSTGVVRTCTNLCTNLVTGVTRCFYLVCAGFAGVTGYHGPFNHAQELQQVLADPKWRNTRAPKLSAPAAIDVRGACLRSLSSSWIVSGAEPRCLGKVRGESVSSSAMVGDRRCSPVVAGYDR